MPNSFDELPTRAEQEQAEALQLYRLAAEQGVAGAQCRLGVMYAEGRGAARDDDESVRWFRMAAEQGDPEAQAGLGLACAAGRGAPQDFVVAYMWLTLAATQLTGVTRHGAVKCRDTIAAGMTAEQVSEGDRRARVWTPTTGPAC